MTQCTKCGRVVASTRALAACPKCGGELSTTSEVIQPSRATESVGRRHFLEVMPTCRTNECGQWGTDGRGRTGCLLHPKCPEQIARHLFDCGGCLADPPLFDPPPDPRGHWLLPEQFFRPESIAPPQSDRLIITVAVGDEAEEQLSLTGPRMEAYAARIGADFRVIRADRTYGRWPMANKWRIATMAKRYSRTLYVDADVIIQPDAPDVFAEHRGTAFYDEFAETRRNVQGNWIQAGVSAICRSQGIDDHRVTRSFNGGVMLLEKSTAKLYRPPDHPVPITWCCDQQWLTVCVDRSDVDVDHLGWQWHNGFVSSRFWKRLPDAYLIHLNGSRPHGYRMRLLQRILAGDYRRIDPPPEANWKPQWTRS